MKSQPAILDLLNDVLTGELTAVNQYWLHARMCKNWGYHRLEEKIRNESVDEMKHADWIIERILFLDGLPNLQRYDKINVGETVPEQLKLDHALELGTVQRLNAGIELARSLGDNGTRELLERILVASEEHVDWLEQQLHLLKELGDAQYLAQQLRG